MDEPIALKLDPEMQRLLHGLHEPPGQQKTGYQGTNRELLVDDP